jgi:cytochrome b561
VPRQKHPSTSKSASTSAAQSLSYSPAARAFHWITVVLVVGLVVVGQWMTYRSGKDIWDGLTNSLYSAHKLTGLVLLGIIIARLAYRLTQGAPADEPTLEPWQKLASHATHWSLYGLLLLVPLLGWRGISQYPALSIFGMFNLPAIATADQPAAAATFFWHATLGKLMALLIVTHVGAAVFHHFVRKDGVLRRMLPNLPQKLK